MSALEKVYHHFPDEASSHLKSALFGERQGREGTASVLNTIHQLHVKENLSASDKCPWPCHCSCASLPHLYLTGEGT